MAFYDRLDAICRARGLQTGSQAVADMFGTTRASIAIWHTRGLTPKGDTVASAADAFGVSADYLLGRTDTPTDYTKVYPEILNMLAEYQTQSRGTRMTTDKVKALSEAERRSAIMSSFSKEEVELLDGFNVLDDVKKTKLLAYLEGLKA